MKTPSAHLKCNLSSPDITPLQQLPCTQSAWLINQVDIAYGQFRMLPIYISHYCHCTTHPRHLSLNSQRSAVLDEQNDNQKRRHSRL